MVNGSSPYLHTSDFAELFGGIAFAAGAVMVALAFFERR